jgi:hypothetical protein
MIIRQMISHYSAVWNRAPERNPRKRDKIVEKLGEGGSGVVCKAEDTDLRPPRSCEGLKRSIAVTANGLTRD